MGQLIIVGAGLAGLSAAVTAGRMGIKSILISDQPSERAQSVLAQGGVNAALDTMGEEDSIKEHYRDSLKCGSYLADPDALGGMTEAAPLILEELADMGIPFCKAGNQIMLRNMGGQKKKRTAYVKNGVGKMIMTALIDETRRYESYGMIERLSHHKFLELYIEEDCRGCFVRDTYTENVCFLEGTVLLACGGLNGLFGELITGSRNNTGEAAAAVFCQGVEMGNLEFIQFHPTTFPICGKRYLVSEAARGEGGRLYKQKKGSPWYFMEDRYPEFGNLMPRDIMAREMSMVCRWADCEPQVYLDMTGIAHTIWKEKLADIKAACIHYLHKDPEKESIPVEPGIHYFMGGILVDKDHCTNIRNVYAAGECACQYHGANRLGGNSILGAIYGGKIAVQSASERLMHWKKIKEAPQWHLEEEYEDMGEVSRYLRKGLGLIRSEIEIAQAAGKLEALLDVVQSRGMKGKRLLLGLAMLRSAYERKESRGAHFRCDYPEEKESYRKTTVASLDGQKLKIEFREIGGGVK